MTGAANPIVRSFSRDQDIRRDHHRSGAGWAIPGRPPQRSRMRIALIERSLSAEPASTPDARHEDARRQRPCRSCRAPRREYGLTIGGPVGVDMKRVKARKDAVVGGSRAGFEAWLKGMANCTVYKGHAHFEAPNKIRGR